MIRPFVSIRSIRTIHPIQWLRSITSIFSTRSIRAKLIVNFLLISILLSAVSVFGFINYQKQSRFLDEIATKDMGQLQLILELNYLFQEKNNAARSYYDLKDKSISKKIELFQKLCQKSLDKAQTLMNKEENKGKRDKYIQFITVLADVNKKYDQKLTEMVKANNEGNLLLSNQRFQETDSLSVQVSLAADSWAKEVEKEVNGQFTQAQENSSMIMGVTAVTILLSSAAAIFLGFFIGIRISAPVKKLAETAALAANGDLSKDIPPAKTKDEINLLTESFAKLVSNLRMAIGRINFTLEELGNNSGLLNKRILVLSENKNRLQAVTQQVTQNFHTQSTLVDKAVEVIESVDIAIEQIAAGASEQSKQVDEATAFVNEVSEAMNHMAGNIQSVHTGAKEAFAIAQEGEKAVKETVQGMGRIKDTVLNTATNVQELGDHSKKIGDIVEVINNIASQTNLLALNAAIEAARAGEHGKGFAVVADEVRLLAEQSASATKEIAGLVSTIQNGIHKIMVSIREGSAIVQEEEHLVVNAGDTLDKITATMEQTMRQVEDITDTANKISISSKGMVKGITSISEIIHQSSSASQQIAAGSHQVVQVIKEIENLSHTERTVIEQTSLAIQEMEDTVDELSESADKLGDMSEQLKEIVSGFHIS